MMETVVAALRYVFAIGLAVEVALILRALFNLAREKAQQPGGAVAGAAPAEE
jgi:hypothetical protein